MLNWCKKYESHIINGGWSKYDKDKCLPIVSVYASSLIKGICFIKASFTKQKITNKNTSKWVWLYALSFIFLLRFPSENWCKCKIPYSTKDGTYKTWYQPVWWKTENVTCDSDICNCAQRAN